MLAEVEILSKKEVEREMGDERALDEESDFEYFVQTNGRCQMPLTKEMCK